MHPDYTIARYAATTPAATTTLAPVTSTMAPVTSTMAPATSTMAPTTTTMAPTTTLAPTSTIAGALLQCCCPLLSGRYRSSSMFRGK